LIQYGINKLQTSNSMSDFSFFGNKSLEK